MDQLEKEVKELQKRFRSLTETEALKLVVMMNSNKIKESILDAITHGLQTHDRSQPTFLEAISMILGFNGDKLKDRGTILDELKKQ